MQSNKDNDTRETLSSESGAVVPNADSGVVHQESELVTYEESFRGPLPPPSTLAQYEETLPGSAERLMTMAEVQAEHRH